MNDEINVADIELEKDQINTCEKLLQAARVEPFVSPEILERVRAAIQLAMKLGMKHEQDAFE